MFINGPKITSGVAPGRRLRVRGVTHNGLFIGGIRPQSIELLEQGPHDGNREEAPVDGEATARRHVERRVPGMVDPRGVRQAVLTDDLHIQMQRGRRGLPVGKRDRRPGVVCCVGHIQRSIASGESGGFDCRQLREFSVV